MGREILQLPGVYDPHVHLRDLKEDQKETFRTGTEAAICGGVVTVLAMPNTKPSIISPDMLQTAIENFRPQAVCDWGLHYGATARNVGEYGEVIDSVFALKMYLNSTHGELLLTDPQVIEAHFRLWPKDRMIMVHAEERTVFDVLEMIKKDPRPVYFCHVSTADEINWLKAAKESGLPVYIEVTPHHLFLTEDDERVLGSLGRMKPPLRTRQDVAALWKNLAVVDTIGSDHAPHTIDEKNSEKPPFGVPGLETTLVLLLTAVAEDRMTMEQLVKLTSVNPAKIFGISQRKSNYVEVDLKERWKIKNGELHTKCGWSPFDGKEVQGRVNAVYIRGNKVYDGEKILVAPGFGQQVLFQRGSNS